jgi:hypothetical protein
MFHNGITSAKGKLSISTLSKFITSNFCRSSASRIEIYCLSTAIYFAFVYELKKVADEYLIDFSISVR